MKQEIVFMDGYDKVCDARTQSGTVFTTKLPQDLSTLLGRDTISEKVVDKIVSIYNESGLEAVDEYLLWEGEISQDEREIIVEALWLFENPQTKEQI